jgi:hypothetical protein
MYNMRSAWAKLNNLADDINMRETDLCFLTEVWQKKESKKHMSAIEEMMEMKGIQYISTPRPGAQRGGGVAIAFPGKDFQVTKLNIDIPSHWSACLPLSNLQILREEPTNSLQFVSTARRGHGGTMNWWT